MTKLGIDYGKGLQLINILRDRRCRRRGGSRLSPGRGIGDYAGRGCLRELARQSGRENHRGDRVLFKPDELADSLCHRAAGFDWRADDRFVARGRDRGGENQGPEKRSSPHFGRRADSGSVAASAASALPAPARATLLDISRFGPGEHRDGSWKLAPSFPYSREHETLADFSRLGCLVRRVRAFRRRAPDGAGRGPVDRWLRRAAARKQRHPDRRRTHHSNRPGRNPGRPQRCRGDLHRRHGRPPRPLGLPRSHHAPRSQRLRALGQDVSATARDARSCRLPRISCSWPG